jgi:hypothetical protein
MSGLIQLRHHPSVLGVLPIHVFLPMPVKSSNGKKSMRPEPQPIGEQSGLSYIPVVKRGSYVKTCSGC